jgi:general secretion pathway protein G
MVVIVIIGLLATLVVPAVVSKLGIANEKKAQADIVSIYNAVSEYAILNNGKYPDSLEALVTPDENGRTLLEAETVPIDPWGNPYAYEPAGPGQPRPRVICYGKDGQPGGEGEDGDFDNVTIKNPGK